MASTFRVVTGPTDLTTVSRYIRHISIAENAADPDAEARALVREGSVAGTIIIDIRVAAKESKHISFTKPLFTAGGVYVLIGFVDRITIRYEVKSVASPS